MIAEDSNTRLFGALKKLILILIIAKDIQRRLIYYGLCHS